MCSTIGVALPSFILIISVSSFLNKFHESRVVTGIFAGIRPITAGLIASAVVVIGKTVLVTGNPYKCCAGCDIRSINSCLQQSSS